MLKKTTLINESARKRLGITRDEYALCAYVHYRIADPNTTQPGWCPDTREEIADFVGITRRGLLKMINRMAEYGLLEVGGTGLLRVGTRWMKEENAWEQSSPKIGNFVPMKREQSSQRGVNKVPKVYKGDNKEEKEELSVSARAKNASPLETETPLSENESSGGGAAQNPPSPESVAYTTDPAELEMLLRTYYMARPDDWKVIKERLDRAAAQAGKKYDKEKIADVVSRYCDWTITKGHTGWTFSQHHSRLRMWMADQPGKELQTNQSATTDAKTGVYTPPKRLITA